MNSTRDVKKYLPFILSLVLLLGACAGRIPSTETAQGIVKGYFNKYGNKYKETPFGGHRVQQVQIVAMEEIQKNLAYGSAVVGLDDGASFKINMNFIYKAPLGWRQQGWEMVSSTVKDTSPSSTADIPLPESSPPIKKKNSQN